MEGRIQQGLLLKRVFDAIKEMVSDVNLECTTSGIQLQAMDASHVSLVSLDLRTAAFDQYRCSRTRSLGLNMSAVTKVFKLCGNDDSVIIRHADESDVVSFVFEAAGEERVSSFELKLMRLDQEHLGIPATEYKACITMPSRHFQRVVTELAQFADSIQIEATPKGVRFSARGDIGTGNVQYKNRPGESERIEVQTEDSVIQTFATRYLSYYTKASALSDMVQICISPDQPLEVTFSLNNNEGHGCLKFYLAPKMDDTMTAE